MDICPVPLGAGLAPGTGGIGTIEKRFKIFWFFGRSCLSGDRKANAVREYCMGELDGIY
jgi:hypothetical protein